MIAPFVVARSVSDEAISGRASPDPATVLNHRGKYKLEQAGKE